MQTRKLILFIAASLDGYIATKEDSLDWLFSVEGDNGYTEFYESVDTVLMGKRTYDWIMDHAEDFPYQNKACYVFTRTDEKGTEHVQFVHGDIVSFTNQLKQQEGKSIWIVGGGELLSAFMKVQLVDELILTLAPVLLGSGIPLFKEGEYQASLNLKQTRTFNQFVELHYEVKKS
ncbi:Dihydrofolate reductase [Terribacillus halophilus]|uniref:Dihydrofolate reductase n=1 Tax=Terribacillus halophilus TaxID=361279 RepID=A0A1G6VVH0_9BACI|nr:dihydrofolate reductase family protein [Terribacillus halophilus]SDD57632.1 Dihydrofolate reductase [Terribacillus halophilus]